MYKQNILRFQNPTISIPFTNNRTCKRGKVRRILGKKNWYLCFDEIRDSKLKKDSTSSLQRKKLNVLHPKEMNLNKPITKNI